MALSGTVLATDITRGFPEANQSTGIMGADARARLVDDLDVAGTHAMVSQSQRWSSHELDGRQRVLADGDVPLKGWKHYSRGAYAMMPSAIPEATRSLWFHRMSC